MLTLALAWPLLGPTLPPAPLPQSPDETLFSLWLGPGAALLSHPKDEALRNAIALLEARLQELPGELPRDDFPQAEFPPELVPWVLGLLEGQKSLRVALDQSAGPLPLAIQLDWEQSDAEQARTRTADLRAFLAGIGAPLEEPDPDGWTSLPARLPLPLGFGPRGTALSLGAGKPIDGRATRTSTQLPQQVVADLVLDLDLGTMIDLVLDTMLVAAPEQAEILEMVIGILALDEITIHSASGLDADFRHTVAHMPDYGSALRSRGLVPEEGIQAAHLRAIPKDALWVDVMRVDLRAMLDLVLAFSQDLLAERGVEDGVEMIAQVTGIHLERDLLDHLGSTIGLYASDTTGGGGIASAVAFIEVTNSAGLQPLLERLQSLINGMGQAEARGYVQVRSWELKGTTCMTLTYPGLPVPLELSLALTDKLLVFGATPRTLATALDQAMGSNPGLLDNEDFQASAALDPIGSYRVSFIDMPRMLRDGYGFISFITSALANGTRSPRDEARDAGIIMPTFHDLKKNARAWTQVTHIDTEHILVRTRSDPSLLATATGVSGFYLSHSLLFLAAGGFGFAGAQESGLMPRGQNPFFR